MRTINFYPSPSGIYVVPTRYHERGPELTSSHQGSVFLRHVNLVVEGYLSTRNTSGKIIKLDLMDRSYLPPRLQVENPTVDEIIEQIDPWIFYQLCSTIDNVHYEHQLYGIFNAYLASVFPLRRRFMIVPQFLLRRVVEPDDIDSYLSNVSFGSTGGFHESRDLSGSENSKLYPDFAVVKVTPHPNGVRAHRIVALVEVKRVDETTSWATQQCTDYLQQAQEHPSRREDLCCYLIQGRSVHVMQTGAEDPDNPEWFDIFSQGDPLTRKLCTIARDEWNEV